MRAEATPWWEQAQADLETARATQTAGRYYAVSWFAQQATEKALKALYMEQQGVLAPRTHDLAQLASLVGASSDVMADVLILNPVFDLVRYLDPRSLSAPVNLIDAAMATRDVEAAERVLLWIAAQLP